MKKDLLHIFIYTALLIISLIPCFDGGWLVNNFGYYVHCDIENRFLYMFIHKHPFHLIINLFALMQLNSFLERFFEYGNEKERTIIAAVSYIICVVGSCMTNSDLPTIGLSGYTSAKYGIILSVIDWRDMFLAIAMFILFNFVFFITGGANYLLHIVCLVMGLIFGLFRERQFR